MATIIKGLLSQNLPWGLVLAGVFITVTLELCGIHACRSRSARTCRSATTAPIFAGGVVRALVEQRDRQGAPNPRSAPARSSARA